MTQLFFVFVFHFWKPEEDKGAKHLLETPPPPLLEHFIVLQHCITVDLMFVCFLFCFFTEDNREKKAL